MKENKITDRNFGIYFEDSCSLFSWWFCGLFHRQKIGQNWMYRSYGRLHLQRSCELTIVRCVFANRTMAKNAPTKRTFALVHVE